MNQQPPRFLQPINWEIPAGMEPIYVNLARISHSPAEIVMDFARLLPGNMPGSMPGNPPGAAGVVPPVNPNLAVQTRLLMSPIGAKLFMRALADNLARYETAYGEIRLPGDTTLAQDLFRNIQPPDTGAGPKNEPPQPDQR